VGLLIFATRWLRQPLPRSLEGNAFVGAACRRTRGSRVDEDCAPLASTRVIDPRHTGAALSSHHRSMQRNTDKGYLNQRAVLARRATAVADLYGSLCTAVIMLTR